MRYNIEYNNIKHYTYVNVSGEIRRDDAIFFLKKALEEARKYNCFHFIFDLRDTIIKDRISDIYETLSNLHSLGFGIHDKFATLFSIDDEKHSFAETVANNAGIRIKYFKNTEEAKRWLSN